MNNVYEFLKKMQGKKKQNWNVSVSLENNGLLFKFDLWTKKGNCRVHYAITLLEIETMDSDIYIENIVEAVNWEFDRLTCTEK